jgi:hypothetical protein
MNFPLDDGSGTAVTFSHLGFEHLDWGVLAVMLGRLVMAAALAAVIAYRPWRWFMRWHFDRPESGAQILIAVAGALMTAVIGNNIARAFGLVGLGGFIRFRSGIKDPREAGVMFLMIGIGMACGIGEMPIALTATAFAIPLLAGLDIADRARRNIARRRFRFGNVTDPRRLEPQVLAAFGKVATIRGSRIRLEDEEVVVDVAGDAIVSASAALELLDAAGVKFAGDVSCEEI